MIASVWRAFGMVTTTPVTDEELQSFATAVGLNRVAAGRYARLFLSQIYNETVMTSARGEAPKIIAEIKHLEGGRTSRTKPADAFKGPALLGLMHKHYFVGGRAAIANNIFAAAGKKKVEFRRIAQRHNNPSTADPLAFEKIGDDVLGLYRDRSEARELTGHWIVFAEHDGKNYYLCLATHEEGKEGGGVVIAERVKTGCCSEFPFLRFCMR
jgi:hypothetical protein